MFTQEDLDGAALEGAKTLCASRSYDLDHGPVHSDDAPCRTCWLEGCSVVTAALVFLNCREVWGGPEVPSQRVRESSSSRTPTPKMALPPRRKRS